MSFCIEFDQLNPCFRGRCPRAGDIIGSRQLKFAEVLLLRQPGFALIHVQATEREPRRSPNPVAIWKHPARFIVHPPVDNLEQPLPAQTTRTNIFPRRMRPLLVTLRACPSEIAMLKRAVDAEQAERDQDADCARIDAAIALAEKDVDALEIGNLPRMQYANSGLLFATGQSLPFAMCVTTS